MPTFASGGPVTFADLQTALCDQSFWLALYWQRRRLDARMVYALQWWAWSVFNDEEWM